MSPYYVRMKLQKGRGAQINPANRFDKHQYFEHLDDPRWWEEEERDPPKTMLIPFPAKNILSKVTSPDLPMEWSLNPYQGCEHGCVYCYARETHAYWGYSAGLDFEQKILYKPNASELLEETLRKPKWQAAPIMLAGNTDIYQPVERQLRLTRSLLEVFWKYRHPVGMITKNSLILRDLDLIKSFLLQPLTKAFAPNWNPVPLQPLNGCAPFARSGKRVSRSSP